MVWWWFVKNAVEYDWVSCSWRCELVSVDVDRWVKALDGSSVIVIAIIGCYEFLVATAHSLVAAVRHRDARFAFQSTMRTQEAPYRVL